MKKHLLICAMLMLSICSFSQWNTIITDASGDSQGLDATTLEYQYDSSMDQVQFRVTLTNLASYSGGPAADFSFFLPNGLESGYGTGNHWTSSTPVHKTAYIYCSPGGTAPSSYTYPSSWPNSMVETIDEFQICSDCIEIFVDVDANQIIYTFDRANIISNAEFDGQSSATIGIVANVGHDVGWDDSVTHSQGGASSAEFTISLDGANSITEVEAKIELKAFPSPANDVLNVTSNVGFDTLIIYDINGREVSQFQNSANNQFNISYLTTGVYTLSILNDGQFIQNTRFTKL